MKERNLFKPFLKSLPEKPGVYLFKDGAGEVIYVGKSVNLRRRVSSYFQKCSLDRKHRHLRARTRKIDFLVLSSESEALEVEQDLIRSLNPEYNIRYLDYGHFPYFLLEKEDKYPALRIKQTKGERDYYFGPFQTDGQIEEVYNALRQVYPVRSCGDLSMQKRNTPCFEFHLDRCPAPCVNDIYSRKYEQNIQEIKEVLSGKKKKILDKIKKRMNNAASGKNFEKAADYRDQLDAVESLSSYKPYLRNILDADVWAGTSSLSLLLRVKNHRLHNFYIWKDKCSVSTLVDNFYGDFVVPAKMLGTEKFQGLNSLSYKVPENEEERKLMKTARRTLSAYERSGKDNTVRSKILDEVFFTPSEVKIKRRIDNKAMENTTLETPPKVFPGDVLMENYEQHLYAGRPLPDEILINSEVDLSKEQLNLQEYSFNIRIKTFGSLGNKIDFSGAEDALG